MSMRGKAAIVGIGEVPTKEVIEGATTKGLCAQASMMAIADAGIRKEDIDGLITYGPENAPYDFAEYIGLRPAHTQGTTAMGSSGWLSTAMAAAAINAGLANYILVVLGAAAPARQAPAPRAPGAPAAPAAPRPAGVGSEFEAPFGPVQAATGGYGLIARRHMYEYGTTSEQLAKIAADERFNAVKNPNAVFYGRPETVADVLNSRLIADPLHLLECVMPCDGAHAIVVTSAERAKIMPHRPVYILGAGGSATTHNTIHQELRIVDSPVKISAPRAFAMAGYGPKDMQFAEFYDWYTILVAVCLEDAGICKKGEIGAFYANTDTTYKGTFPINTDGGQLSGGQTGGMGGGFRHVIEATRQIMGRAGERQVPKNDLCLGNGWGGTMSMMSTVVLGSENTL